MSLTSNIYLENKCQALDIPVKVLDITELRELDPQMGYIINEGHNSHWVALYVNHHFIAYHDSFGVVPSLKIEQCIRTYAKKHHTRIDFIYNQKEIQNFNGGYCGQYCIAFLNIMNHGKGKLIDRLVTYQKKFSDNPLKNEKKLIKYLHSIRFFNVSNSEKEP